MSIYDTLLAPAARGRCPACHRQMVAGHPRRRPTRDHIWPRAWGKGPPGFRQRVLCHDCNVLRGLAGHCLGMVACARAVAAPDYAAVHRLLIHWRRIMPTVSVPPRLPTMVRPSTDLRNPPHSERSSSGQARDSRAA
jgi:hypothetical protein